MVTPPHPAYREFVDHMTVLQTFNNPSNHSSSCESAGCPFIFNPVFVHGRAVSMRPTSLCTARPTHQSIDNETCGYSMPPRYLLFPPPCNSLQLGHLRQARGGVVGVGRASRPVPRAPVEGGEPRSSLLITQRRQVLTETVPKLTTCRAGFQRWTGLICCSISTTRIANFLANPVPFLEGRPGL